MEHETVHVSGAFGALEHKRWLRSSCSLDFADRLMVHERRGTKPQGQAAFPAAFSFPLIWASVAVYS